MHPMSLEHMTLPSILLIIEEVLFELELIGIFSMTCDASLYFSLIVWDLIASSLSSNFCYNTNFTWLCAMCTVDIQYYVNF